MEQVGMVDKVKQILEQVAKFEGSDEGVLQCDGLRGF